MDRFKSLRKLVGPAADTWTEAELERADDNLRRYVDIALRIFERLERKSLTLSSEGHIMNDEDPPVDFSNSQINL